MTDSAPKSYSADPTLYLYTSLTAGSSHIITATSRLETILKANKIPFRALDVATDEKARMLWGRRSKGKKLPGLVKFGTIVGDLEEVEEWNEYGELKQQIGATPVLNTAPAVSTKTETKPAPAPAFKDTSGSQSPHVQFTEPSDSHEHPVGSTPKKDETPLALAMRQAGTAAAKIAEEKKTSKPTLQTTTVSDLAEVSDSKSAGKLSKAAEDPTASSETTASKVPAILAAEGAKRTSVDKIANTEQGTEVGKSGLLTEEDLHDLRKHSSVTNVKSPLSSEAAIDSATSVEDVEAPRLYRGSSISAASKEEIECIEQSQAIPEEEETSSNEGTSDRVALSDITSSNAGERAVTKDSKAQDQGAKDADAAGISVGD